jgi:colicin import membrane protein
MKLVAMALALLGLLCVLPLGAQDDPVQGLPSASAERQRIAAEQAKANALYEAQELACYDRFAVNGCLKDVQSRRRATQADLQRQETSLHDSERLQKGAEQLRLLEQKTKERKQKELEVQQTRSDNRAPAKPQAQKERQDVQTTGSMSAESGRAVSVPSGPTPAEQVRNRESYAAKQAEAEKKRQEIAKRQQNKAHKSAPGLPVPHSVQ